MFGSVFCVVFSAFSAFSSGLLCFVLFYDLLLLILFCTSGPSYEWPHYYVIFYIMLKLFCKEEWAKMSLQ